MSPGHGSPLSTSPASPPAGPDEAMHPATVVGLMMSPPSGITQWSSSGPATAPPVAPEHVPGASMGPVPPSAAVYSVELGGKVWPLPLLLLLQAARTISKSSE